MAYATVSDVEIDAGTIAEGQIDKVETLLERAEDQITMTVGDLAARMAAGVTTLSLIKQVEAEMVSTVLGNQAGLRSSTETVGPFSRTVSFGGSYTTGNDPGFGRLIVTDRHKVLLGVRPLLGPFSVPLGGA